MVDNLNLAGVDRAFVCTAIASHTVLFTQCAIRLKRSGTTIPRIELVEVGPSMDLVVRRHRLPNESLQKEAMKIASKEHKKVDLPTPVHQTHVSDICNCSFLFSHSIDICSMPTDHTFTF